jgi:solute carrier family 25 protein 39/40
MAVPATVLYFTAYDELKHQLLPHFGKYSPIMAGVSSRFFASTVTSPLELLRTQQMAHRSSPGLSIFQQSRMVALSTWQNARQHGFFTLWRGLGPTLWRDVPFSGIYWYSYEGLKQHALQHLSNPEEGSFTTGFMIPWFAGATSGALSAVLTMPFDVAKTKVQVEQFRGSTSKPRGMLSVLREIRKGGGFPELFLGVVPRVARVAPACAIMIGCYEYGKQFFSTS